MAPLNDDYHFLSTPPLTKPRTLNLPKDNFSPESGGRVKSRTAMEEIRRQGTIKLKK